jgi:ligand-binding sensor domain-containing protein
LPEFAFPQSFFSQSFTPIDGLSSSYVFDARQDSSGRLIFATSNGVSRFDGYNFVSIPVKGNLKDNSFVRIFTGKNGKLWFLTYQGELAYYNDTALISYRFNDYIINHGFRQVMSTVWVDVNDHVYFKDKSFENFIEITTDN